mgnify:FL=1
MNDAFKDYFSDQSNAYAHYRPRYADKLFDWLANQVPAHDLCWDCATGSGQAAMSLAHHFEKVVATDASEQQISNAIRAERIDYRVATAEDSGLDAESCDLVSVAQALHWFDIDAFFTEVDRILKPGGMLAVMSYGLFRIAPDIDDLILTLYRDILKDDWPQERKLVEQGYADIEMPYSELSVPQFYMHADWNYAQLTGYLNTWSAVKRHTRVNGVSPLQQIDKTLCSAWGDPTSMHRIEWPMTVRVARKPA